MSANLRVTPALQQLLWSQIESYDASVYRKIADGGKQSLTLAETLELREVLTFISEEWDVIEPREKRLAKRWLVRLGGRAG